MSSSTGNVPAQQVPARNKSGQKLKQSAAPSEPAIATGRPTVGYPSTTHEGTPSKRKLDAHAPPHSNSSHVAKRPRKDETTTNRNGQLKKKKSVTFADVPSKNDNTTTNSNSKTAAANTPQKKSKGPAKKKKTPPPSDIKPALEYLRLWKTARSSWKFNKNHQSTLIKHVFDADGIPGADIETFYDYIQDLKGFVRMRLRETALGIRTKDQSEGGDAFPEGTTDVDATQERYETLLARFLQSQPVGSKRKGFAEEAYVSDSDDGEVIIERLVKRMRAELVIDELSDGDTEMSTTSSVSSRTLIGSDNNITTTTDKKVKLNDGTGKRRRKLRTNLDSDTESSSSSSSSDSDSDSDTSDSDESESGSGTSSSGSTSSSDDSSSDDDEERDDGNESSSSSSASSSSDADSDDTSSDGSDNEDESNA